MPEGHIVRSILFHANRMQNVVCDNKPACRTCSLFATSQTPVRRLGQHLLRAGRDFAVAVEQGAVQIEGRKKDGVR